MKLKLKALCESKAITPYQLADKIEVDRNTVYSWVNNRTFPRVNQLDKLFEFFNCEITDLLEK